MDIVYCTFVATPLKISCAIHSNRPGQARSTARVRCKLPSPRSPCSFPGQMLIAPTRSIVHCHALDPRRHVSILATFAFVSPRLAAVAIVSRSRSRCSGSEIMLNGLIYNVCFCCREKRGKGKERREAAHNPIAMRLSHATRKAFAICRSAWECACPSRGVCMCV